MTIDSRATGCRSEGLWGGRKPGLWLASMARYLEHKHGNAPRQIRRKARERSQRVQVLGLRQPQTQKRAEATALARLMAVSVDLDLRRFGLGLLLDRHLEHTVLVAGLDLVVARVVGQLERPANRSVAPNRAKGNRELGTTPRFFTKLAPAPKGRLAAPRSGRRNRRRRSRFDALARPD